MGPENLQRNALLLAIAIGLFAWCVSIALMPEGAFTDSLHHLTVARQIAESGAVRTDSFLNPPLYHVVTAGFILLLGFNSFAFKAVAFFFAAAFLVACYFLFRKLLPKDNLLALVLTLFNPVLLLYFSANYTDVSAAFFLALSLLLLISFCEKRTKFLAASFLVCLALGVLSKATFWVAAPVLLAAFLYTAFGKKRIDSKKALILAALLSIAYFAFCIWQGEGSFYYRYFIPAFPLVSFLLASAFSTRLKKFRNPFIAIVLLASAVSLVFCAGTVVMFRQNFEGNQELYIFLSTLPKDSMIVVMPNDERRVEFYSGIHAEFFRPEFNRLSAAGLASRLNAEGATHIGVVCYNDSWDLQKLEELERQGFASKVFSGKCSSAYALTAASGG